MGSGKTTLGVKLAGLLQFNFIDLDQYIEEKENKSIPLIFENEGEDAFRKAESNYLTEITKMPSNMVVALGGGTICSERNLELVRNNGVLVYIDVDASELANRLKNDHSGRPLLKNVNAHDLEEMIRQKLIIREPYYHRAHIKVKGNGITENILQQKILGFKN